MAGMGKNTVSSLFAFIIILIALISTVAAFYFLRAPKITKGPIHEEVKRVIMSNYQILQQTDHQTVDKINEASDTAQELNSIYPDWDKNYYNFKLVCQFGIRILQHYAIFEEKKYLDAAAKIIVAMNLNVLSNYDKNSPTFSINNMLETCAQFLVAYQIVNDDLSNDANSIICYNFIEKLVPGLNKMNSSSFIHKIYGNTSLLLSSYVNNYEKYQKEIDSDAMENFKSDIKTFKGYSGYSIYCYYDDIFVAFNNWR